MNPNDSATELSPVDTTAPGTLPLKEMRYTGAIDGVAADMQLELRYGNTLENPVEAVFVFPMVPEAAITGIEVRVGDRAIFAELRERDDARAVYETARDGGHHAALLEQERPNIFTMSVGGISPGEDITVTAKYLHRVDWQNGGGRFVLPLVVAPHFVHGDPLQQSRGRGFSPDTTEVPDASLITPRVAVDPNDITYHASIRLTFTPGFASHVSCPSYDLLIPSRQYERDESFVVELDNLNPDRDLTITYRSLEQRPTVRASVTEFLATDNLRERFLMLQITPPVEALPNREKPREVVLCLDRSSSMQGPAIDGLRRVACNVVRRLSESGVPIRLGVLAFADKPQILAPLSTLQDPELFVDVIQRIESYGGTQAGRALTQALGMFSAKSDSPVERSIIFVTDGDTLDVHVDGLETSGIRIHSVGISSAVDHEVLKLMAERSGGSTFRIFPGEDYDVAAREIAARTAGPLVRAISLYGVPDWALIGGRDLWGQDPQLIFMHTIAEMPPELLLSGLGANGEAVSWIVTSEEIGQFKAIPQLWAREKLRSEIENLQATEISQRYGIMGRTTAFVAVMEKATPTGVPLRVDIPVSLPLGWEMEGEWAQSPGLTVALGSYTDSMDVMLCCLDCNDFDSGEAVDLFGGAGLWDLNAEHIEQLHRPPLLDLAERFYRNLKNPLLIGFTESMAEKAWIELVVKVDEQRAVHFSDWSERDKSELFMLLTRVRAYGYRMDLPVDIQSRPASGDDEALLFWAEGQRAIGVQVSV